MIYERDITLHHNSNQQNEKKGKIVHEKNIYWLSLYKRPKALYYINEKHLLFFSLLIAVTWNNKSKIYAVVFLFFLLFYWWVECDISNFCLHVGKSLKKFGKFGWYEWWLHSTQIFLIFPYEIYSVKYTNPNPSF